MYYGIYDSEPNLDRDIPEPGIDYEPEQPFFCSCGMCMDCLMLSEEDYK